MLNQFDYFVNGGLPGLEDFFKTEQEESERLEFKSGELPLEKLYREVCAFANTDGGIIIYGAPRETESTVLTGKEKRKVCVGALSPTKVDKTQDWFNQKLMTGITPAILGIKICKLSDSNGHVYIINVPQSNHSPHQVEGTYYMRVNSMTTPAPHAFVVASLNKRKPIDLDFELNVLCEGVPSAQMQFHSMRVSVTNKSDYPAHDVEGIFILIGKIREKAKSDGKSFSTEYLKNDRIRLTQRISFPSSVVLNLWIWYEMYDLIVESDYHYAQVYIWAADTPAQRKSYKVFKNCELLELNPDDNQTEFDEIKSWIVAPE